MFVELEGLVVAHAVRNDTGAYDVTITAYRIDTTTAVEVAHTTTVVPAVGDPADPLVDRSCIA